MIRKTHAGFESRLRRFFSASAELFPLLSGFEITRLSWGRKITAFDDLPQQFQPAVRELLPDRLVFPYSVLTPTFEGFLRRENAKLIFIQNDRLHILEDTRSEIIPTIFPVEKIHTIEFGSILLKAWMILRGVNSTGQLAETTLRFNAVTDHYFIPFVTDVRTLDSPPAPADSQTIIDQQRRKFAPLASQHFKFMNYARRSLLPGERVLQYIMQPELRAARLELFGGSLLSRMTCLAHITILTDRELIWIRDEENGLRWREDVRYGGIWTYLPLRLIQNVEIRAAEDDLIHLIVHLPAGDQIFIPFSAGRRPELEGFSRLMQK